MISRRRLLQLAGALPFVSCDPTENAASDNPVWRIFPALKLCKVGDLTIGPFGEDRIITRLELTTGGDWLVETVPVHSGWDGEELRA